jgi:molecular chaperone DnaK (HSP70)/uncharacterized Tic20 family protein
MNTSLPTAVAIDLGTSNTVAVIRAGAGTRGLLVDGREIMPSAVFLDEADEFSVGQIAVNQANADPSRYEPNPKRQLGRNVVLGGRSMPATALLAAVLSRVAVEARRSAPMAPRAVLTHPVVWGGDRRDLLVEAARAAGLNVAYLVEEPIAAAAYLMSVMRLHVPPGGAIAVVDFGGGTMDIAVIRNENGRLAVLGSAGLADLGGLDIDDVVWSHLGDRVEERSADVWRRLNEPQTYAEARDSRIFRNEVRDAKERLSSLASTAVHVPGLDEAVTLSRIELDNLATPLLYRGVAVTREVIEASGLRAAGLTHLFLVGGGARMPLIASMLHRELGIPVTVPPSPERPVAEGALFAPQSNPGPAPVHAPPQRPRQTNVPPQQPPYVPLQQPPDVPPGPNVAGPQRKELEDARMAHIWGAIGAFVSCGLLGWVGPLIYLNGAGARSPYARKHAVAALNVQLLNLIAQLISIPLSLVGVGLVTFIVLWIYAVVWGFIASGKAGAGQEYKYPLTLPFAK